MTIDDLRRLARKVNMLGRSMHVGTGLVVFLTDEEVREKEILCATIPGLLDRLEAMERELKALRESVD